MNKISLDSPIAIWTTSTLVAYTFTVVDYDFVSRAASTHHFFLLLITLRSQLRLKILLTNIWVFNLREREHYKA